MRTSIFYEGQEELFLASILGKQYSQVILLADANTNGFCINVLKKQIRALSTASLIIIPQGEQHKILESCSLIWNEFERLQADRSSLLINVGGGMISDIGGFAASVYKRGIDVVNIPTTLLAMVDACYGGKNGIDLNGVKNVIGTFRHPQSIYINTVFLATLDQRILQSGIAECLKHALISSEALWNELSSFELTDFLSLPTIRKILEIKTIIADLDEKDQSIRQTLNFGHSIGHAIESYSQQTAHPLLHGEAVYLGMLHELKLSEMMLQLPSSVYASLQNAGKKFFDSLSFSYTYKDLEPFLLQDKKNREGIRMSLLKNIGECTFQTFVTTENIRNSFQ